MLLRVLLILLTFSFSRQEAAAAPTLEKGLLDLRTVDLSQAEPIELTGEWEFYWDRLISSAEAEALTGERTYRMVPLPWSESRPGYPAYPAFGKASYRLRILLPDVHPTLLLRIPETFTAFNVFINGQRMAVRTEAGLNEASTHTSRRTVYVPIESTLTEVDLMFQVANYVSGTGGIWRSLSLGNTEVIMDLRSKQQFQMLLAVSALGVMCSYHFILFLFRREHLDNLWFSLFCLMIFVRSFLVGNDLMLYNVVSDFDWTWSRRIEFISFYWAVALSVIFIRNLFPTDMKAITLRILVPIITLATLIVLTQPHVIFRKTLFVMQIVGIISILFCLVTIILAVIRKRPQALTMLGGFLMMATGTIHDILNSILRFDTLELSSVGVIGCVVTTSIVISKRFSMAFDQLRVAQEAIRVHNEQLDQLVKEKTLDIRSIFANIPQAIFAIQRDGRLNAEVSDYFRDLFQPEPLMRARHLLERIFDQSQLSADQVDQITNAVDFCLDGEILSFELNEHVFPHQLIKTMNATKRSFEMDWNPIVDEQGNIQKLLICMRDTTELNELRIKTLESEKRVKIVAELLDKDHGQVMAWLEQAIRELGDVLDRHASSHQSLTDTTRETLRLLHTQKGNARSLGLGTSASSVHACEQELLDMNVGPSANFAEVLAGLLHELMFTRDILKSLHIKVGTTPSSSSTSSLCTLVVGTLEQLAPLAQRLNKELPECHGLDLLQSQALHLTPDLAYILRGALNHILTNIMDHGLESREERAQKGKPVRGAIAFHLFEDREHWTLQITDDGRGLPRQAIEQRLKLLGRPIPTEADALAQVLLESGFSTRDVVSDLSGRGLGLDAVASAFVKTGGTFRIATRARSRDAAPQLVFILTLPKAAFAGSDHAAVA